MYVYTCMGTGYHMHVQAHRNDNVHNVARPRHRPRRGKLLMRKASSAKGSSNEVLATLCPHTCLNRARNQIDSRNL